MSTSTSIKVMVFIIGVGWVIANTVTGVRAASTFAIPATTCYSTGDINRDGKVDTTDISTLTTNLVNGRATNAVTGDVNSDGVINTSDLVTLRQMVAKKWVAFGVGARNPYASVSGTDDTLVGSDVYTQAIDKSGNFIVTNFKNDKYRQFNSIDRSGNRLWIGSVTESNIMGMEDRYYYMEQALPYTSLDLGRRTTNNSSIAYNGTFLGKSATIIKSEDSYSSGVTWRQVEIFDANGNFVCTYVSFKVNGSWRYVAGCSKGQSTFCAGIIDTRTVQKGFDAIF